MRPTKSSNTQPRRRSRSERLALTYVETYKGVVINSDQVTYSDGSVHTRFYPVVPPFSPFFESIEDARSMVDKYKMLPIIIGVSVVGIVGIGAIIYF